MATSLPALSIQPPGIDIVGSINRGYELRQNRNQSALSDIDLKEKQGEASALSNYRAGLAKDDPNAGDALKQYPEIHTKFDELHNKIADDKEKRAALVRSKAVGEAARTISMYPENSPQRKAAGDTAVDQLVQAGHLTPQMGEEAKRSGYTNLLLQQYLELGDWANRQLPDPGKELLREKTQTDIDLKKARIDYLKKGDPKGSGDTLDNYKKIHDMVDAERKRLEDSVPTEDLGEDATPEEKQAAAESQKSYIESKLLNYQRMLERRFMGTEPPSNRPPARAGASPQAEDVPDEPGKLKPAFDVRPPIGDGKMSPAQQSIVDSANKAPPSKNVDDRTVGNQPTGEWDYRRVNGKLYVKSPDGRIFAVPEGSNGG